MKYLLDTCVVSETISRNPNPVVNAWLNGIDEEDLFISSLTVGEIRKGIVKMPECKRKAVLTDWLDQLKANYVGRIVYVSTEVADEWGKRIALCEKKGLKKPSVDSLIAVSAAFEGLTLVTRNVTDMANLGAVIFNPWDGQYTRDTE